MNRKIGMIVQKENPPTSLHNLASDVENKFVKSCNPETVNRMLRMLIPSERLLFIRACIGDIVVEFLEEHPYSLTIKEYPLPGCSLKYEHAILVSDHLPVASGLFRWFRSAVSHCNSQNGRVLINEIIEVFRDYKDELSIPLREYVLSEGIIEICYRVQIDDSELMRQVIDLLFESWSSFGSLHFSAILKPSHYRASGGRTPADAKQPDFLTFYLEHARRMKLEYNGVRFIDVSVYSSIRKAPVFIAADIWCWKPLLRYLQFGAKFENVVVDPSTTRQGVQSALTDTLRNLIRHLWVRLVQPADSLSLTDSEVIQEYCSNLNREVRDLCHTLKIILRTIKRLRYDSLEFIIRDHSDQWVVDVNSHRVIDHPAVHIPFSGPGVRTMDSIIKLNKAKTSLKGRITRIENFLDKVSKDTNLTDLEVKLKKIDQLQQNVDNLRRNSFELDNVTTAELTAFEHDLEECDIRLENLEVRIKTSINSISKPPSVTAIPRNENESLNVSTKIPPLILPTFSGKYEQFSNFKSQFDDLITSNEQLTQSQKLYYLNSCLSNEVKEFASSFDTFASLYAALESRYDNKRFIIDIHVQSILDFKKIEYENPREIRDMIDCIQKNLRALKVLKYEQNDLFDIFLINVMLNKLDKESRKNFELSQKSKDVPTFEQFITFLEQREAVLLSVIRNCTAEAKPFMKKSHFSTKTKTLLVKQNNENKSCPICCEKTPHLVYRCVKFLELTPQKRFDLVRLHKLCELCLRKNHKKIECNSSYVCNCSQRHSKAICFRQESEKRRPAASDNINKPTPSCDVSEIKIPKFLELSDPQFFESKEIHALLNADIFFKIMKDNVYKVNEELLFRETEFGWVASGRLDEIKTIDVGSCFLISERSIEDTLKQFFDLESLGIKDDPCFREKDQALQIFNDTVQFNNGRYIVELPFRKHFKELSDNFLIAKQRFQNLWRRLQRDTDLHLQYQETIQDYLNQGIIEKVDTSECNKDKPIYFLPHQVVKKEDNWITGQDTQEEALLISRNAKNIMKEAGMVMRKWISNDSALMNQWKAEGFDTYPMDTSVCLGTIFLSNHHPIKRGCWEDRPPPMDREWRHSSWRRHRECSAYEIYVLQSINKYKKEFEREKTSYDAKRCMRFAMKAIFRNYGDCGKDDLWGTFLRTGPMVKSSVPEVNETMDTLDGEAPGLVVECGNVYAYRDFLRFFCSGDSPIHFHETVHICHCFLGDDHMHLTRS
ncbi:unnamed protein product [Larinioides sclopetarius]|uniref:Uncharacterized protein n=1 Tax=Larinioides sclopetarius TaxID=280406 RepID=A0AAV1YWA9_9ARAC